MKIVFMGTPYFGVQILNALVKEHEVVLVVTQPDKEVGRKHIKTAPPVKVRAQELGIDVFQPNNIREEYQYILDNYDFDLIVSATYGQIVGTKLLFYPKFKAINVHASLLPKGRGGAPIQRSIMNGDKETGITIMYMGKGMDTGDILAQEKLMIEDSDTKESLFNKLGELGANMINNIIDKLAKGDITPIPQNEEEVTYSYNITKDDEQLDFNISAFLVNCKVRALNDIGSSFSVNDVNFKIYHAEVVNEKCEMEAGKVSEVNKKYINIACGDKSQIRIYELKPEGRNLMKVSDYLNGKGKDIIIKGAKCN